MNYDENIYAEVVFDGIETYAPERMGMPKPDQLQGTTFERLVELAGRVCYDSLGKGRSSEAYHQHIAEVGHGSVWEHANATFRVPRFVENLPDTALLFLNRPGVWVRFGDDGALRVTMNLRSIVEFDQFTENDVFVMVGPVLKLALRGAISPYAPQIVQCSKETQHATTVTVVPPEHPEEKWVSLLLGGSRGMSHEQVRHKWRVAISQRSTRYVDESESPWVEHPLITAFQEHGPDRDCDRIVPSGDDPAAYALSDLAQTTYAATVEALQPWLQARTDKHTARKQARGAARGYLGNALHTELIFSASVAQWKRMIAMRCSSHADAEIRVLYGHVIRALQTTRWADDFEDLKLVPSPDGIGEVLG